MEFFNDSDGYLNMDIYRSAGYPIFLWLIKKIFGSQMDLATVILQMSIGIGCMYIFVTRLRHILKIPKLWYLLLAIIIATPYFYTLNLANNYLSEALTYPLYLLTVLFFLECFITKNVKKLWISIPVLIVLITTRNQFLFMVPIALLILVWLSIKEKSVKKYVWAGIAFLVLPIFTTLTDKTYHQVKHGYFVNTPWTGIHLLTPAFFVADEGDYQLYDSEEEQQFFKWIYAKLYHNHLNVNNLNEDGKYDASGFYSNHFTDIANATLYESGKELVGTNLNEDQKFIALDELTKKMAFPLVLDNFGLWFKLYVKNIINAFGNAKYASIYVILLLVSFISLLKRESDEYKLITLLTLMTLSNVALVAIGMHTIKRFTFYNDWVLFLIIFILLNTFIKHRESSL